MKIYTKRGDKGDTDLFGGLRVEKNSLRIEAIGSVDEVNTWVGMILSGEVDSMVRDDLIGVQKDLFVLGADLATPGVMVPVRGADDVPRVSEESVVRLEEIIDRLEMSLEPMTAFILPGGSPVAARLHVARSVCRRAERVCVKLMRDEDDGNGENQDCVVKYLNRLSDLFFVMARFENHVKGVEEVKWRG